MKTQTELDAFRSDKDHFFAHDPRSPLAAGQLKGFHGLAYFPEDPSLVIDAAIDRSAAGGEVRMETTRGREQAFRPHGVARFSIDGQPVELTLYGTDGSDSLFLPFRDATSGRETYGGGRYLDLEADGDRVVIDFNYAYNPFCAYNSAWECPLPPAENWLKVPIRAGEQVFPGSEAH